MKELLNKIPWENFHKDKGSSAIGLVIIIASLASVFLVPNMNWEGAGTGLTIGLGLLFSNTNRGGGDGNGGANPADQPAAPAPKIVVPGAGLILVFCLLFLLPSCVTYQRCYDKYGSLSKDTVRVNMSVKIPVADTVPADSLKFALQLDSLRKLAPGDTFYVRDTVSKIQVKYWKDKYQNILHERADYKSNIRHDTIVKTIQAPCPPVAMFQQPAPKAKAEKAKLPGRLGLFWEKIKNGLLLLLAMVIILCFMNFFKR